jgi:hypothetical protein
MKQRITFILKSAFFLIVTLILSLFIFGLPRIMSGLSEVIPVPAYLRYPGLIALYAAMIPFLFGLYQILRLFININKNKAFSELSVRTLKNIKYCSSTISVLYIISLPLLFILADKDDAPGILLFGLIVIFFNGVGAVFASVFKKRYYSNKIS